MGTDTIVSAVLLTNERGEELARWTFTGPPVVPRVGEYVMVRGEKLMRPVCRVMYGTFAVPLESDHDVRVVVSLGPLTDVDALDAALRGEEPRT